MSRFVVLEHDHPRRHWDLMFEQGEVLATWALAEPPNASWPILAEPLPDHRRAYLDYEGPVSNGRGSVTRWDQGEFILLRGAFAAHLTVELRGEKLRGTFTLTRQSASRYSFARLDLNETSLDRL